MVLAEPGTMSFLDAAEEILRLHGSPLSPVEIVDRAVSAGILVSSGETPSQTLKSKLSVDILRKHEASRFKRTGPNTFALRSWPIPEFIADRFKKALLDEEIIVFDSCWLREFVPADGLVMLTPDEGRDLIALTYSMQRRVAETMYDVIQLVSQFLVVMDGRIATHKRTRRLPEARLHGVYSMLFGGHLNPDDVLPLFSPFDPMAGPMFITRELEEELRIIDAEPEISLVGGIYDPRSDVSRQHLGVLYVVDVPKDARIEIGERGFLQHLQFETPQQILERIGDFENWSELVLRDLALEKLA